MMNAIEKAVAKMRKESAEFMVFPEARFTIAKYIHAYLHSKATQEKSASYKFKNLDENCGVSFGDQLIYRTYVSNILNILQE